MAKKQDVKLIAKFLPNEMLAQIGTPYEFDKVTMVAEHCFYALAKTQSMFVYHNLPETIPQAMLENYLQTIGYTIFVPNANGKPYVFFGGAGGGLDPYYRPTKVIVSNPALGFNEELEVDKECVLIFNDSMHIGLLPIFRKYGTLLAENEISIRVGTINSRMAQRIEANTEGEKQEAEKYLKKIEQGDLAVLLGKSPLLDENGAKAQPASTDIRFLTGHIELEQYLKASELNEIGLNSNYNMKRESINSNESQLNEDALIPLIDDMLKCRKEALHKINSMFNFNITVELNSVWAEKQDSEEPEEPKEGAENDS